MSKSRKGRYLEIVIVTAVTVIVGAVASAFIGLGCRGQVSDDTAIHAAATFGFTEAQVTERHDRAPDWHGCGENDAAAFQMTGRNPAGMQANFIMCCRANGLGCSLNAQ